LGTLFLVDSNALIGPVAATEDPTLPEISLQLQVRNSDGALVAYIEPTVFYLRSVSHIHEFLDAEENKTIIIKDGKTYEQIEFEYEHFSETGEQQISAYFLTWKGGTPLVSFYNGYLSDAGDTLTASWKIIRTVQ